MIKTNTLLAAGVSLTLLATAAHGDLGSSTYGKAREEFARDNCYEALPLLKQYQREDSKFLDQNPRVSSAINSAVSYCQEILFPYLPGTSYPTGPPQKPDLPVNLAHAFDSGARLRTVIAELREGRPNYEQIEPMLRIALRQQITTWAARLQTLGAMQSLAYEGEQQGAAVYEVKFEHGTTAWMIGIAANGNIAVLVFQ